VVVVIGKDEREEVVNIVYQGLKRPSSVFEAKWHEKILKKAERGQNCCFCNVCMLYGYLEVACDYIYH
jgi:hypothetical protein